MFLYLSLEVVSTFVLCLHYWPSLFSQDGYILAKFFIAVLLTETKSRLYHQPLVGKWARAPLPNRRPERAVEIGPRQSLFIILQGWQPLILFLILRSGLNAVTLMKRSKPDWKVNRRYTNAWVWKNQSPNFLCTCVLLFYYFNGSLSSCLRGNSKRKKTRKSSENLSFFFRGGMLSFLCPASMQIYWN